MLSAYDRWLLPRETYIPELDDGEDESRILLDILIRDFRRNACAHFPEASVRQWLETLIGDGVIYEALVKEHRTEIDVQWAEEHEG